MKKNELLKKIRIDNGLSRSKIAKILEVAPVTIEKYENNKLPIKPNLKYIKGISALYGYDNNIFDYDEINEKIIERYKLTSFGKAIRTYLYFSSKYEMNELGMLYFISDLFNLKDMNERLMQISKNLYNDYIVDIDFINNSYREEEFFKIFIILTLNTFKVSAFGQIDNYIKALKYKDYFLENYECFYNNHILSLSIDELKNKINLLEKSGLELTPDNIKHLNTLDKIEKELHNNNPKHKEICTLLEYAPEPFKDKLLNKLREYKKDIEEL